jgi:fructose-1,6-bisphosphatase/inositol monophosphatase family enzyme
MIRDPERLLAQIRALHDQIAAAVVARAEGGPVEALAAVETDAGAGDTIYAVDRVSEAELVAFFEREVAPERPLILIAEGLPDAGLGEGRLMLPRGLPESAAEVRVLIDPIDGTRGLMYQKRSAWVLTGVAPDRGPATRLRDVELAVQTEVPLAKQHLADQLWAVRGAGLRAERRDRLTGARTPFRPRPSGASTVEHGFATIARYFPGGREELAALDEEVTRAALGPVRRGKAQSFEDQYICTGGQLYEVLVGHDRFVADLRPLLEPLLARRGHATGICAHPYDLAAVLIAEEGGVLVTDGRGGPLDAPLDVESDVAWAAFANATIRAQIEPHLIAALRRRGLL